MSDKLIESFLKYEEQRKAQKNPNEFQSVKNLQERNIIRRADKDKDEPAPAATPPVGAGEALRPEIAGPEQGSPVSAMARPGDTRFGNFNTDGTVSGNTSVTDARAGVRTEPRAITPSTGDSVRDAANAGKSMTVQYADTSVVNTDNKEVSIIPTGGAARQEPEDRTPDSTGGTRSISGSVDTGYSGGPDETRYHRGVGDIGPATPEQIGDRDPGADYSGGPDATRDRREADDTPPATPTSSTGRTSATSTHTVASGDNLSTLAQKNNLSVRDIMAANPDITDPHKIRVGQTIRIPRSLAASDKKIYAGGVGAGGPTNESVQFSEAELAHFKSILEAMPVAPTAEGHGPNPTPKNKAEGGKGRGSLSEMKKK